MWVHAVGIEWPNRVHTNMVESVQSRLHADVSDLPRGMAAERLRAGQHYLPSTQTTRSCSR